MKIKYDKLPEIDLLEVGAEQIPIAEWMLARVLASHFGPQKGQVVGTLGTGCGFVACICWFRGAKVIVIDSEPQGRTCTEGLKRANRPQGGGTLTIIKDTSGLQKSQLNLLLYLGTQDPSLEQAIELGERYLQHCGQLLLYVPSKRRKEEAERHLRNWGEVKVLDIRSRDNGDWRYIIEAFRPAK